MAPLAQLAIPPDDVLAACPLCQWPESITIATRGVLYNRLEELGPLGSHLCPRCSVIYTNPRLSRATLAEFYRTEQQTRRPEASREALATAAESAKTRARLALVMPFLGDDARVLEVGSGDANFVLSLARRRPGAEVMGVDPSLLLSGRPLPNLTLVKDHLDDLEVPARVSGPFHCIVAFHVLEHQHAPREFLLRLGGLLAEGGLLFLEIPNTYRSFRLGKGMEVFFRVVHLYNYGRRALAFLLKASGFEPVAWDAANPKALRVVSRLKSGAVPSVAPVPLAPHEIAAIRRYFACWQAYSTLRRTAVLRHVAPYFAALAWRRVRGPLAAAGL
jgi:2-polyprenyl-3-methyl-5-hydroxy-6-metoxy-1,4-benzoquinol methylase